MYYCKTRNQDVPDELLQASRESGHAFITLFSNDNEIIKSLQII